MNNRSKTTKKPTGADTNNDRTGWPDVAIKFIDAIYNLAQTGNLIGLVAFCVFCWLMLATYRLPPESLEGLLLGMGRFLGSEKFYFFPLIAALATSVITNIVQARVYKAHIHDLTEHRKLLVHGLKSGELTPLKTHRSSGFDLKSNSIKPK